MSRSEMFDVKQRWEICVLCRSC